MYRILFYSLILLAGIGFSDSKATAQGAYLETQNDHLDIYYEEEGRGPTIIFIPGWTMTTAFFQKQKKHFKDRYRVICYDPRSQGRSEKTLRGNTYAQHAVDLRELVTQLGLSDVILVGWSSGCLTMYAYLQQFGTDRIDRMVLIDEPPKWIGDREKEWVYGNFEGYRGSLYGLLNNRRADAYDIVDWMLNETADSLTRNWMVSEMMLTPDHAALSLYVDGMIADYAKVLRSIEDSVPVLFLLRSSWYEYGKSWLQQYVPSAQVLAISSHAMFWERPAAFNDLLEIFFEE